jgi:hypothetical protein
MNLFGFNSLWALRQQQPQRLVITETTMWCVHRGDCGRPVITNTRAITWWHWSQWFRLLAENLRLLLGAVWKVWSILSCVYFRKTLSIFSLYFFVLFKHWWCWYEKEFPKRGSSKLEKLCYSIVTSNFKERHKKIGEQRESFFNPSSDRTCNFFLSALNLWYHKVNGGVI